MGRLRMTCCCGASIELSAWGARDIDTGDWAKVHAFCTNAWQREHGLDVRLSFPDQDKESE